MSLHAHTNRSREGMTVLPAYLERIPIVGSLVRRELRAYEHRHHEPVDFARGWWHPPVGPEEVLASEREQVLRRLGLRPIVSITDHDSIDAPLALYESSRATEDVPLSLEWTVPFEPGFLHLGVHNLPRAAGREIFDALWTYSSAPDEALLEDVLEWLHETPETLVVLNHPIWDLAGVGRARHVSLVHRFLAGHGGRIHAVEVNGYRSWSENSEAIRLAEALALPIVSGGDRHGCAPNALLNLTSADSFAEFAVEIREERRSVVLLMPEYREPLVSRKLAVASDALREYPAYPRGQQRWLDRVSYEHEGRIRRLSDHWSEGGPLWVRSATRLFEIGARGHLLPAVRLLVWMAGASMSDRPGAAGRGETVVPLPARRASYPETTA